MLFAIAAFKQSKAKRKVKEGGSVTNSSFIHIAIDKKHLFPLIEFLLKYSFAQ